MLMTHLCPLTYLNIYMINIELKETYQNPNSILCLQKISNDLPKRI